MRDGRTTVANSHCLALVIDSKCVADAAARQRSEVDWFVVKLCAGRQDGHQNDRHKEADHALAMIQTFHTYLSKVVVSPGPTWPEFPEAVPIAGPLRFNELPLIRKAKISGRFCGMA